MHSGAPGAGQTSKTDLNNPARLPSRIIVLQSTERSETSAGAARVGAAGGSSGRLMCRFKALELPPPELLPTRDETMEAGEGVTDMEPADLERVIPGVCCDEAEAMVVGVPGAASTLDLDAERHDDCGVRVCKEITRTTKEN